GSDHNFPHDRADVLCNRHERPAPQHLEVVARGEDAGPDDRTGVRGYAGDDLDSWSFFARNGTAPFSGILRGDLDRHGACFGDADLVDGDRSRQWVVQRCGADVVDRLVEVDVATQHRGQGDVERVPGLFQDRRVIIGEYVLQRHVERHQCDVEPRGEYLGCGCGGVGDVRFRMVGDVARHPDRPTHDDELANALRQCGISVEGAGDVGQWADREDIELTVVEVRQMQQQVNPCLGTRGAVHG